ncbi:MAG: galactosyltransferase-related protein [Mariniphaga sp.]|jgi:predicted glycosyltransferase involved in capsule biosynthesis|nr:galactosyltransferase-related protein [Mariniphaga sp.]
MKDELAFVIPIRLDSIDRIENIISVVSFLFQNGFQNIRLMEGSSFCNGILEKLFGQEIHYTFIEDHDPVFHRTRYINRMVTEATTPYVAVWDTDVVIAPEQVRQAIKLLISGQADFVIPYEKQALDTTPIIRKLFMENGNIKTLVQNRKKMKEMYAPNPLGGAFMVNREAYIKAGMENEDFYGWGMEDGERFYRWQSRGYKIKRVPGPLYHLTHGRGINSMFHNPDQGLWKRKETLKAKRLAGYGQNGVE